MISVKKFSKQIGLSVKDVRQHLKTEAYPLKNAYDKTTDEIDQNSIHVVEYLKELGVEHTFKSDTDDLLAKFDRDQLEAMQVAEKIQKLQLEREIKRGELVSKDKVKKLFQKQISFSEKLLSDKAGNIAAQFFSMRDLDDLTEDDYRQKIDEIMTSALTAFIKELKQIYSIFNED